MPGSVTTRSLRGIARKLSRRLRGAQDLEALQRRGLVLGHGVYIGERTFIDYDFPWLVAIGDDTTISLEVIVLAHDASTKRTTGRARVARVDIGSRVFVGARAIILPGVAIGDDAIVGAGSVVVRDIPAGAIAAGNPARVIAETAAYAERHRERMRRRPVWDYHGAGITPEQRAEMAAALRDGGEGYVP